MSGARKRLLLTGASGLLGTAILDSWPARWDIAALVGRTRIVLPGVENVSGDLTAPSTLGEVVERARPDLVVHCAAWTDLDGCEANPSLARTIHSDASGALAAAAYRCGAGFVYVSTDSLFSTSTGSGPNGLHTEDDPIDPRSVYAKTKREGEEATLAAHASALVARTCIIGWNAQRKTSMAEWMIAELRAGRVVKAFTDVAFTPILTTTFAAGIESLVASEARGVFHVAGGEAITKHDFAVALADVFDLPRALVVPSALAGVALRAPRPPSPCLDSSRYAARIGARLQAPVDALHEMKRLEATGFRDRARTFIAT